MATVTLVTQGRQKKRTTPKHHRFTLALPYLIPAVVLYGWFLLYPMLDAVRLSFFEWSGFRTEQPSFVGIDNYITLFTQDAVFWTAFRNSVLWVIASLVIPTGIALLLALGLNRKMIGRNLMRAVFYIPAVFASITVAAMWRWIYNPTLGFVNQALTSVGLGEWTQSWLGDPQFALASIFIANIWQAVGFSMVLFLAGLQTVPVELVEAAKLDGANAWQRFRAVTVPALRPTTVVVVILTIINSLKVFDLVVGMTGGGPAQSTQVLALWSYTQSFTNHQFGMGGAVATVLLIVTLALVIPYMAWSMKGEDR
ncbi:carbohydrate ABC transporter permease [Microbacterium sp. Bi128]|uniref:carbohydrate ABC transporter permease n=1 Tax=Microbacterium sp. Bi128 TaxID=2821115 RepID=UPI001DEF2038|nr:sugar ABC transporter permease [Microbacterium sp. Bi128]CAH0140272.1 Lactose transport system permease protein LacF [Microbacterium sp. Bi128]